MANNLTEVEQSERLRLSAQGAVNEAGDFEITAITAGEANGWLFSAEVLKRSLPLWNGVACFVDHAPLGRSLKDLGGVCSEPRWSESEAGVRLRLRAVGPSAALVQALGREMLAGAGAARPRVGFSADIAFTAGGAGAVGGGRPVKEILRVYSLDLVFDPARGGAFVRALNQLQNGQEAFMSNLEGAAGSLSAVANEVEAVRQARLQTCQYLLESGLAASKLPAPMQQHVRAQFAGTVFEPAQLQAALAQARDLVSSLTGAATVAGPQRIHGMHDSQDMIQAAFDDLLGAPRDAALRGLKTHRLSGIREAYHLLTGDYDFHGGFYADRAQLATTADFTGLVKNALNKIVVNQWEMLGRAGYDWWQRVVTVEHFETLNTITGTLVGTVGTLPSIAERGEYTELAIGDSAETASFTKYGGYIPLTLELIDRDETRKLRQYSVELANAGLRRLSGLVAAIFTANAGVGPTLADGGALFNNTAVTSAGGHANLRTTALGAGEWDTVASAVYAQPQLIKNASGYYGTGPALAVAPKYLLVPRQLRLTAMQILYPSLERTANIYSENMQRGEPGDVVVVPEWTDATDWAAVCDPRVAPAIYVGERFGLLPEIFIAGDQLSPAVFMNDEHRLKVRQFVAVWVNDFRPVHKSNVAG